jgi:hypothetical protein
VYTERNFKTKKALKEAFERGDKIFVYQPGGMFPARVPGTQFLEGPHYPAPHTWYASGEADKDCMLTSLKGSKAKWVGGAFVPGPVKLTRAKEGVATVTTRSHVERTLFGERL